MNTATAVTAPRDTAAPYVPGDWAMWCFILAELAAFGGLLDGARLSRTAQVGFMIRE